MCGEDAQGNALADAEPKAVRLTRKKEILKDIRLLHPEGTGANSPCSISAREIEINALVEIGLGIDGSDRISRMNGITNKVRAWASASENNRAVTCVPGGVVNLTVCPC